MINQSLNIQPHHDMATAKIPTIQNFSGETSEDVTTCVTNCRFMIKLYELDKKSALKLIFSSLKGNAFDWARDILTQEPELGSADVLSRLSSRFLSRLKITETAQRFLSMKFHQRVKNFLTC